MDQLKHRIKHQVGTIQARINALDKQKQIYNDLRMSISNKVTDDRVMVTIGDGYFVEHTVDKARAFLLRRVDMMDTDLKTLRHNLDSAEKALSDLGQIDIPESLQNGQEQEEREEEEFADLPVMDIREELDEDGNILSSSVEPQNDDYSALKQLNAEAKVVKPPPKTKVVQQPAPPPEPKVEAEVEAEAEPQIEKIVEVTEEPLKDKQTATQHGIATEELLQLELINNELEEDEDEEEFYDDDEFEMESEDEDEEDEFGRHKGRPLIEKWSKEELDRRMKEAEKKLAESKLATTPKKSVAFSPQVEVKSFDKTLAANDQPPQIEEIEEVKEEEISKPKPKKVSRFKAERVEAGVSKTAVADVVPKEERVSDVMEREPLIAPQPKREYKPPNKKPSRFAQQAKARKAQPAVVPEVDNERFDPEVDGFSTEVDAETKLQQEIDERARELYNDAIVTEEEFLQAHDHDDEDEDKVEDKKPSGQADRPVLSTEVMERDHVVDYESDDENDVDMTGIAADYQRLRSKLVQKTGGWGKTDKEQEVEPIDEYGNERKISRFKAATIANRH